MDDGAPDIVTAGGGLYISLLSNIIISGTESFHTGSVDTGSHPTALVAADFNGDGAVDLAAVATSDNTVKLLMGDANTNQLENFNLSYATGASPAAAVAADFNGDGRVDLAVVNQGDGTVSILFGQAPPAISCTPSNFIFTVASPSQTTLSQTCLTNFPSGVNVGVITIAR